MGLPAALRISFAAWAIAVLALLGALPAAHAGIGIPTERVRNLASQPVLQAQPESAARHLFAELGSIEEEDEEPRLLGSALVDPIRWPRLAGPSAAHASALRCGRRALPQATGPPA